MIAFEVGGSMTERIATDVRETADAIVEVCRSVVALESGSTLDDRVPPELPPLDAGLPLAVLANRAGLDEVAAGVLRLLVAAELDRRAHRCMRRLAQDPTQPGIEVDAVVTAAEGVGFAADVALEVLDTDGMLVARGLVEWTRAAGPLLTRRVTIAPSILRHVRGIATPIDPRFGTSRLGVPLAQLALADATAIVDGEPRHRFAELLGEAASGRPPWLVGPAGVGKRTLVASLAAHEARVVRCLDYRQLAARSLAELVPALWREALLHDAVLVIHHCDAHTDGDAMRTPTALYAALARARVPVVFTSTEPPRLAELDPTPLVLELALPPAERRAALWQDALGATDEQRELAELAWRLPLAPGRVVRAATIAHELAAARGAALSARDVRAAVSQQVAQQVAGLGRRIADAQSWDDVVLPAETMDGITELVARVRLRKQVLQDWGFQRKLAKGTGLAAMFLGPPGTGKTMVAGIIAKELDLELYQVDMSRVASKWIGETEKNLAAIFDAAEGANVLLLFDECDSLFTKRSEVKSSNDRHANAEVNYLLQRIERFEGVCILTTNLESSIDAAFKRRLAFRIQFAVPDAKEREMLWRRMMPREANVARIDFAAFARTYELAGGNIRNAVLRAAFLAAADGSPITESHLERSVVLEYRDAGKLSPGGRIN